MPVSLWCSGGAGCHRASLPGSVLLCQVGMSVVVTESCAVLVSLCTDCKKQSTLSSISCSSYKNSLFLLCLQIRNYTAEHTGAILLKYFLCYNRKKIASESMKEIAVIKLQNILQNIWEKIKINLGKLKDTRREGRRQRKKEMTERKT